MEPPFNQAPASIDPDMPHPRDISETFPTKSWKYIQTGIAPYRFPQETGEAVAASARKASKAWAEALESGSWTEVGENGFILAVFDKTNELRIRNRRAEHERGIYGHSNTIKEWREKTEPYIKIGYDLATDQYPSPAPAFAKVRDWVRIALDYSYMNLLDGFAHLPLKDCGDLDHSVFKGFEVEPTKLISSGYKVAFTSPENARIILNTRLKPSTSEGSRKSAIKEEQAAKLTEGQASAIAHATL